MTHMWASKCGERIIKERNDIKKAILMLQQRQISELTV